MTTGPEIETATTTGAETTGATTIEVAMMIGAMIGGMTGIATTTAVMTDAAMIAMRTAEIGRTAETGAVTHRAGEGACEQSDAFSSVSRSARGFNLDTLS
mmetsp:Transcript_38776/g.80650  ORF Transcript_38776/g.80650 Transcript_38776/m.80650 type:complete len:100 (-) Transcript_38776:8-307(-)